ncbi:hypothetical protein [Martelella sp. HB161492]|uniref:hypothetical protein n=1 Tax=Martelella sp. HB161492 TaxID=2720726 RepID=UPI0015919465|nr:hypothetical protein [Martelella sp. HB161492]
MARSPLQARQSPRISVNDLALYMVSSDTARMGIVRRAKYPQTPPIIRYRDVRSVLCQYLSDPLRPVNRLVDAEDIFQQRIDDPSIRDLARDDARHSIDVLHAIQGMQNQLASFDFHHAPQDQDKLEIAGVEVSVRADLLLHASARGVQQIGAAVLRMTMDDAETDAARQKRREMGIYAATLARLHLDQNIPTDRQPVNRLCLSIDIQHGEVFEAPNSSTRRINDIESVCRVIAALWPTI